MRVRVEYPSPRKVAIDERGEPGPGHPSTLTPPPKRMQPRPGHILAEGIQAVDIARYGVVVEVALDHAPQPAAALGDRLVHATRQCLSNRLEAGTHPLRR